MRKHWNCLPYFLFYVEIHKINIGLQYELNMFKSIFLYLKHIYLFHKQTDTDMFIQYLPFNDVFCEVKNTNF